MNIRIFYTLLAVWLCHHTSAQSNHRSTRLSRELARYHVSAFAGLTQFFGELREQDMKGLIGVNLGRRVGRSWAVNLDLAAGKLGGQKVEFFNSYFVNEYNSIELTGKWNISEQFRGRQKGPFDFSVYTGIGLMIFHANAFDLTTDERVRFTNSEQSARNPLFLRWGKPKGPPGIKKTHEGMLPVGLSLDYALNDKWKAGITYRFYFVRTDKLDATSGWRLINPEEAESYSDTPNDKYGFLGLSLTHLLGDPNERKKQNRR